MKKLTKAVLAERDGLTATLHETFTALEEALETFNTAMQTAWEEDITPRIEACNDALANAKEWVETQVAEMEQYIEERSERWEDSPAGQTYKAWKHEFEYIELESIDLECPDPVELETSNPAEAIDALDEQPISG